MPILMISGYGTVDEAVHALQYGADDFVTKPVEPSVLGERVAALLTRRPRPTPPSGGANRLRVQIVGHAPAMREVRDAIDAVAPTDATVLITGETGTWKELVARAIHVQSRRSNGPFVAANCAALAPGVIESELFGHVRGAFTGAVQDRPGLFRSAHGGTIFLDEIGDISPEFQHRLLRVLEEHEVTPVGSARPVQVDVRVIAATNCDIRAALSAGAFREDLFYRLNVFRIHVPPLRDRTDDIPALSEAILEELAARNRASATALSPFALRLLRAHTWPGNVRELRAALESALIRANGARLQPHHLPDDVRACTEPRAERYRAPPVMDERASIVAALRDADGVRARAAELLGMGRTTLWRKMKEYGLES